MQTGLKIINEVDRNIFQMKRGGGNFQLWTLHSTAVSIPATVAPQQWCVAGVIDLQAALFENRQWEVVGGRLFMEAVTRRAGSGDGPRFRGAFADFRAWIDR